MRKASRWSFVVEAQVVGWFKRLGLQGKRMTTVCGYRPDFVLDTLIIEVDGPSHAAPKQQRIDAENDKNWAEAGYRVLRLTDAEVENGSGFAKLKAAL